MGQPAIESFNYMFHGGLKKVARDIIPVEFELKNGQKVKLKISKINILQPTVGETVIPQPKILQIFPKECRMRNSTYKGKLQVQIFWSVNGKAQIPFDRCLGEIPVMVFNQE
jgi:DNA-directed RNA polymerase I subunit RPA2